ncbi:MAG: 4-hydroxy-tetrahydrodipicolinate reductase [Gemmatimonadaceae bacterium]
MSRRRIAIVGDGRMGRTIRDLAIENGWEVTAMLGASDTDGGKGINKTTLRGAEVSLEFTEPRAAVANISACLRSGVPTVCGTTGWYDALPDVSRVATETGTGLLWSPNFSIGINVLIELAKSAGTLLKGLEEFDAHIVETHHSKKKDTPSGTAIAIRKVTGEALDRAIATTSVRTGSVPGTHELIFDGTFEQLTLTHIARDRRVFAEGALRAADWLVGRKGVFTMRDVLSFS